MNYDEFIKDIHEIIDHLSDLIAMFSGLGWTSLLFLLLFLLIQEPDRAVKIQSIITKILYYFFKVCSKRYVASTVSSSVTTFFKNNITRYIPSSLNFRLKIKWVSSPADPILSEDGTVIIRLHESNDQTRNILNATQLILPHVVCPNIRKSIRNDLNEVIDLTLLRKMSQSLGNHAYLTFQKYYLEPEITDGNISKKLFHDLVEIDNNGIFVPIFLEELSALGIKLSDTEEISDKSESIEGFLVYLLAIAKRGLGEHVRLDYIEADFKVSIILMAKSRKAEMEGVKPYISRINKDLALGADSIYLIAYAQAFKFMKSVLSVAESDMKITATLMKKIRIANGKSRENHIAISNIRRNNVVTDDIFKQRIQNMGVNEGDIVNGNILSVSGDEAIVDVFGINAVISCKEISWFTITDCRTILDEETVQDFLIKSIDYESDKIELSLRFPNLDPWKSSFFPNLNDELNVSITGSVNNHLISRFENSVEILVPNNEATWNYADLKASESMIGQSYRLRITEIDEENKKIYGSIKVLLDDPWGRIYKDLPKGTELRVSVDNVTGGEVIVDIADDLKGIIPHAAMKEAGHEYADFADTLIKGQKLDVVVTKVNRKNQRISLNLKRNIQQS